MISPLVLFVWCVTILVEGVTSWVVLRSKVYKYLPFFCACIWFYFTRSLVLFFVAHPLGQRAYFLAYYITDLVGFALMISTLAEASLDVFRSLRVLPAKTVAMAIVIFAQAVFIGLIFAVLVPGNGGNHLMMVAQTCERLLAFIVLSSLLIVASVAAFLGLKWPRHSYLIAIALMSYYVCAVATAWIRTLVSDSYGGVLNIVAMLSFQGMLLFWSLKFRKEDSTGGRAEMEQIPLFSFVEKMKAPPEPTPVMNKPWADQ